MKYELQKFLAQRGSVEQMEDEPVEGTLLVGDKILFRWNDNQSSYGYDRCTISPAFINGERCWVVEEVWESANGYNASGYEERIIDYKDGLNLLIDLDAFEQLFSIED